MEQENIDYPHYRLSFHSEYFTEFARYLVKTGEIEDLEGLLLYIEMPGAWTADYIQYVKTTPSIVNDARRRSAWSIPQ